VQRELLDETPEAEVSVYAVSFHMLPSDHLARRLVWPEDLMGDPRVKHFWDEERLVGRWYEEEVTKIGRPGEGRVEWDAFFLYGPDAVWEEEEPPELVSWGRTIAGSRERLGRDFRALLEQ
jgi:hypothetical protein